MNPIKPIITGQVAVDASPAEVYRLVSDPTAMADLAEELASARWLDGAAEAAVGARFSGLNRNGWRRWTTICEVTDVVPERRFAYEVSTPFKTPIARWQYDIEPVGDGCVVTVTNWIKVPDWFVPFALWISGEPDRPATNKANIATTLGRLKEHVESIVSVR